MSLPSSARGIALIWTGVGVLKFWRARGWSRRGSNPRESKVGVVGLGGVGDGGEEDDEGTSDESSLRFMVEREEFEELSSVCV